MLIIKTLWSLFETYYRLFSSSLFQTNEVLNIDIISSMLFWLFIYLFFTSRVFTTYNVNFRTWQVVFHIFKDIFNSLGYFRHLLQVTFDVAGYFKQMWVIAIYVIVNILQVIFNIGYMRLSSTCETDFSMRLYPAYTDLFSTKLS